MNALINQKMFSLHNCFWEQIEEDSIAKKN
jgi:hypothetical protein